MESKRSKKSAAFRTGRSFSAHCVHRAKNASASLERLGGSTQMVSENGSAQLGARNSSSDFCGAGHSLRSVRRTARISRAFSLSSEANDRIDSWLGTSERNRTHSAD